MMMKRLLSVAAAAAALALAMTGCSSGASGGSNNSASGKSQSCSNKIVNKSAPVVSVWAWYPNTKTVVDNFNNQHDSVQICWNNVGQGTEEYNKVQTAISAKKGLPDVVMLEADHLPTYEIQGALVDISKYGANKVKANYGPGAWSDVSQGNAVYAIPVDGGPMGLIYRPDIFKKYGVNTPPTTWKEFTADAEKVKAAGGPLFADLAGNQPATMMAYLVQNGAVPFKYNMSESKTDIGINLNSPAAKEVFTYWSQMVKKGLIGTEDQFTSDFISGLTNGKYATYPSAAWTPGYMQGAGVGKSNAKWATAPMPQWNPSSPVSINWGGSTFAVTTQASNKKLAAEVAMGLYADAASLKDGWTNQVIFPLNQKVLSSPAFINSRTAFFGGQMANKEVYVPAENAYKGMVYSPFQTYYYAQLQAAVTSINQGKATGAQAADSLQAKVVKYAKSQGFTVTQ